MKRIVLLILIAVLLTACSGGATSSSGVQAWLDQPITGTILPLGGFTLKAHARHISGSGVNKIEFLVNGVSVGVVDTDSASPIVYAETIWNASTPGEYLLSSRAYAGGESSESTPVRVCVSSDVQIATLSSSGSCEDAVAGAFPPPTEDIPPPIPGGAPLIEMKAEASPSYVYYGVCPPANPTMVNFNVYVADPGAVLTILVGYSLLDLSGVAVATGSVETTSPGIGGPTNYLLSLDMNTATAGVGTLITQLEFTPQGLDVLGNVVTVAVPPHRISVEKCASSGASSDSATITVAPPTAVPPTPAPVMDTTAPNVKITLVDPVTLYYGNGCSSNSGILTVEAYVADGQSSISDVYLIYGFVGAGAEGIFANMTPTGGGYYRAVIDIGGQAYNFFQGANGEIGIAVIGNDSAGNSAQDTSGNIPLLFCPG